MGKLWLENCTSEKIPQGQRGWSFIPLRSATWLLFAQVPREGTAWSHWSQHSQPVEGTWVGCQGHPLRLELEKRNSSCPGLALSPDNWPCLAIQSSFYSHSQPRPSALVSCFICFFVPSSRNPPLVPASAAVLSLLEMYLKLKMKC